MYTVNIKKVVSEMTNHLAYVVTSYDDLKNDTKSACDYINMIDSNFRKYNVACQFVFFTRDGNEIINCEDIENAEICGSYIVAYVKGAGHTKLRALKRSRFVDDTLSGATYVFNIYPSSITKVSKVIEKYMSDIVAAFRELANDLM